MQVVPRSLAPVVAGLLGLVLAVTSAGYLVAHPVFLGPVRLPDPPPLPPAVVTAPAPISLPEVPEIPQRFLPVTRAASVPWDGMNCERCGAPLVRTWQEAGRDYAACARGHYSRREGMRWELAFAGTLPPSVQQRQRREAGFR